MVATASLPGFLSVATARFLELELKQVLKPKLELEPEPELELGNRNLKNFLLLRWRPHYSMTSLTCGYHFTIKLLHLHGFLLHIVRTLIHINFFLYL